MDPSTCGYFRKVVVVLIQRKHDLLVEFIQGKGLVDKLVDRIGLYSVMELLIMIGWDDGLGQVHDVAWLYKENLIPKLVDKLDPKYENEPDVHVNAARALVDVVVKCMPSQPSLLVSHLQSAPLLDTIFVHMFSGSMSSLTNALSLVIVLVQRDAIRRSDLPDEDALYADWTLPVLMQKVFDHLPQVFQWLSQPAKEDTLDTQYGALSPPFGETRMKAVELILVLFRSNYREINAQLVKLEVLPCIMDLFFEYEWNNMLHGLVESVIRTILDSRSEELKRALFSQTNMIARIRKAYEWNAQCEQAPKGCRLGYMGHLVRTCNALAQYLKRDEQLADVLTDDEMQAWDELVTTYLANDNDAQQTVLGGHRPQSPFGATGSEDDVFDSIRPPHDPSLDGMDEDDEYDFKEDADDDDEHGYGGVYGGDDNENYFGFQMHMNQQYQWDQGEQHFEDHGDDDFGNFEAAFDNRADTSDEEDIVHQDDSGDEEEYQHNSNHHHQQQHQPMGAEQEEAHGAVAQEEDQQQVQGAGAGATEDGTDEFNPRS